MEQKYDAVALGGLLTDFTQNGVSGKPIQFFAENNSVLFTSLRQYTRQQRSSQPIQREG